MKTKYIVVCKENENETFRKEYKSINEITKDFNDFNYFQLYQIYLQSTNKTNRKQHKNGVINKLYQKMKIYDKELNFSPNQNSSAEVVE
jgi:hypothetical protein